ncbi:MAG: ABC transporter substrate-binding protein [Alphaproteobacteria bacterium]|jgi:branched-chain amino acid transport system substrate-binding protein|nr:ABC transporter substrate-binding protein [Alphaproteobacteria bacterium]
MKIWTTLGAAAIAASAIASTASAKDLVIGFMCDRTGPTSVTGTALCPGYHDYVNLVNSKGGIMGNKVIVNEIDHEYKVPPAVEAYQKFKTQNAVLVSPYGTPMVFALVQKMAEDKIPGTSAGFGTALAGNGERYPYMFPIAASYYSQSAAAVQFAKDQLGGSLKGKKIAYIFYDNPAGREGIPILEKLAPKEGFTYRTFAVPPPGVEMGPQILDITRRFRADFVISHLFGRAPSVSLKEFKRAGYPLNKVVGFVWAGSEGDIIASGGWEAAEGYNTMHFAGVGSDYPVLQEIRDMYKAQGKEEPDAMQYTAYYNRGVFQAAVHLAAIENAVKAKGSADITGTDVRDGFYEIKDYTLGGLLPPLQITRKDHEGGGWVRIFQATKDGYKPNTDWYRAYRAEVRELLEAEIAHTK